MSAPIPIKKEEKEENNNGGYFSSWFAKKQKANKEHLEEEIFSMDDDELPFEVTPNPPTEDDLNCIDSSDEKNEQDEQDESCFGFPCSNQIYHGHCKNCEENSICNLISESVQQGFNDMRYDIQSLWKKDVVKIWTGFITVCYFNIPNEALFCSIMYLVHKKFEEKEKEILNQDPLEEDDEGEEKEIEMTEQIKNKKCV